MSSRQVDIRITAAIDVGFCVWEAGEVVAALKDRADVAEWVERRLGRIEGELNREEGERQERVIEMPNVMRLPTTKVARRL